MNNTKCIVKTCRLLSIMALVLMSVLGLTSCIQQEPALDFECDIISAELKGMPDGTNFFLPPRIDNNSITFLVTKIPLPTEKLSLENVILSSGATISPDPTVPRDFSKPVSYTVKSKDGPWSKKYTVQLMEVGIPNDFSFELVDIVDENPPKTDGYQVFYENYRGKDIDIWASGNAGFQIATILLPPVPPSGYPTSSAVGEGCDSTGAPNVGNAAKLVTCSTGSFGAMVDMPIAAGSLFLGTFDGPSAMSKPLEATRFGVPYNKEPTSFEGWYHYKRGPIFTDKYNNTLPDRQDEPSIYAVLYKPTAEKPFIDGSTDISTSDQIVAVAQVAKPANGWSTTYEKFTAPFTYTGYPVEFNQTIADNFGYNITIVFTSSKEGASFKGALGSTLYIDEVTLHTETP